MRIFFSLEDEFLALFHHSTVFPKLVWFELCCSLPRFGCLKGEGDCQQVWQLLTQGARGSWQQKEGAFPTGTTAPVGSTVKSRAMVAWAPACSWHPWFRWGNHHREKTFQKDCLEPQQARWEGGVIQAFQNEICCRSLRHPPTAATAASFTISMSVTPSPFQLLPIFLCLTPCWGLLLGKAQLKSGQLLLNCMNTVDAKCWLENILCWCFIGSGCFLGAEQSGSNWQNYSLAWKRKNEIPPLNLHSC